MSYFPAAWFCSWMLDIVRFTLLSGGFCCFLLNCFELGQNAVTKVKSIWAEYCKVTCVRIYYVVILHPVLTGLNSSLVRFLVAALSLSCVSGALLVLVHVGSRSGSVLLSWDWPELISQWWRQVKKQENWQFVIIGDYLGWSVSGDGHHTIHLNIKN